MDTSDREGELAGPVMMHPDAAIPNDVLHAAYVALLSALARHEPNALQRVGLILEDEGQERGERAAGTAVTLARSWLVFTGHRESTEASEGSFSFAYPATVTFDLVGTGTALRAIEGDDVPLCGFSGPHPTHPALLNVAVWVGSIGDERSGDRLRFELAWHDDEADG